MTIMHYSIEMVSVCLCLAVCLAVAVAVCPSHCSEFIQVMNDKISNLYHLQSRAAVDQPTHQAVSSGGTVVSASIGPCVAWSQPAVLIIAGRSRVREEALC